MKPQRPKPSGGKPDRRGVEAPGHIQCQLSHLSSPFCDSFGTLARKLDPPKSEGTRQSGGCVEETHAVVGLMVRSGYMWMFGTYEAKHERT